MSTLFIIAGVAVWELIAQPLFERRRLLRNASVLDRAH